MTNKQKTAGASSPKKRTLVRRPLGTLAGVIAETTKVYREARDGKLDHDKARSLVWMLGQLRTMIETSTLERLESRLDELSATMGGQGYGHTSSTRPSASTH